MKKLFLALLIVALSCLPVYAGAVNKTIISETQLDDDPTSVTSTTFNIQGYDEVGFWVIYDETEVGNSVSAAVTLDISYDASTWLDAPFWDLGGTTTMQTSETLSSDSHYYCALPKEYYPPGSILYVRMVITATNTDADDLATVTAYLLGTK